MKNEETSRAKKTYTTDIMNITLKIDSWKQCVSNVYNKLTRGNNKITLGGAEMTNFVAELSIQILIK